jgi:hypothetical protein
MGGDPHVQTWSVRRVLCAEVAVAFETVDALVCLTTLMTTSSI